ncbi:hypothetical protein BJ508DRAFT_181887 [Ascobolus immersus RN42]|uniref:Uncharacterized protein n=1 Tax=Ascobolus immersus RN42 TaxID=1160509 RepID=A0A3N4HS41_ASCIM|nr:hypothetical protein BJ508DRAFT_181887 [Ascobolus immersus RN42]
MNRWRLLEERRKYEEMSAYYDAYFADKCTTNPQVGTVSVSSGSCLHPESQTDERLWFLKDPVQKFGHDPCGYLCTETHNFYLSIPWSESFIKVYKKLLYKSADEDGEAPLPWHFSDAFASSLESALAWMDAVHSYGQGDVEEDLYNALIYVEVRPDPKLQLYSLHLLMEQYTLFYMNFVLPTFIQNMSEAEHVKLDSFDKFRIAYFAPFFSTRYDGMIILKARQEAGLLRTNQVRLVECILRATMDVIKKWQAQVEERNEDTDVSEITSTLFGLCEILNFFTDEQFRSERLEVLLVRYLSEVDDINIEVINGLEKAEKNYRDQCQAAPAGQRYREDLHPNAASR